MRSVAFILTIASCWFAGCSANVDEPQQQPPPPGEQAEASAEPLALVNYRTFTLPVRDSSGNLSNTAQLVPTNDYVCGLSGFGGPTSPTRLARLYQSNGYWYLYDSAATSPGWVVLASAVCYLRSFFRGSDCTGSCNPYSSETVVSAPPYRVANTQAAKYATILTGIYGNFASPNDFVEANQCYSPTQATSQLYINSASGGTKFGFSIGYNPPTTQNADDLIYPYPLAAGSQLGYATSVDWQLCQTSSCFCYLTSVVGILSTFVDGGVLYAGSDGFWHITVAGASGGVLMWFNCLTR